MAGRVLNRRELRKQSDQAADAKTPPLVKKAKKPSAAPKVRKPRTKKLPPRMCARWGIFDGGMKQIAIFDFNQRAAADSKLADLLAKKKGTHFMQIVKGLMQEPEAVEAVLPA